MALTAKRQKSLSVFCASAEVVQILMLAKSQQCNRLVPLSTAKPERGGRASGEAAALRVKHAVQKMRGFFELGLVLQGHSLSSSPAARKLANIW
jgi:hypothetical protein